MVLPFQEFNFSTDEEVSISELVDILCDLTHVSRNRFVVEGPERPERFFYRLGHSSASELNWSPMVNLSQV